MSATKETFEVLREGEPPLRFERLASRHIPALLPIEHESYPDPWTQGMFRQEIISETSHFFMVYQDHDLVGCGGFWLILDEAHITKLTVSTRHRRRGLGKEILHFLLEQGRREGAVRTSLEVREMNTPARELYEKSGFEEIGMRKGYYRRTGETAVVMSRPLV